MPLISFAHTTPALLAGRKTVTRRNWDHGYAGRFHRGQDVDAWNRSPRKGGRPVAVIRLVADPTYEPLSAMMDDDYEAEGFAYLYEHPECLPRTLWGRRVGRDDFSLAAFQAIRRERGGVMMWVVRFELVRIIDGDQALMGGPQGWDQIGSPRK